MKPWRMLASAWLYYWLFSVGGRVLLPVSFSVRDELTLQMLPPITISVRIEVRKVMNNMTQKKKSIINITRVEGRKVQFNT